MSCIARTITDHLKLELCSVYTIPDGFKVLIDSGGSVSVFDNEVTNSIEVMEDGIVICQKGKNKGAIAYRYEGIASVAIQIPNERGG